MIRRLLRFGLLHAMRLASLLLALSIVSFLLVRLAPIDPVQAYVGADLLKVSEQQREEIAAYWGLDKPLPQQYLAWGGAVLRGDLGTSMTYREPVASVIADRFWPSLALMASAWLLSSVIGFAAGAIAAMNRDRWPDRLIQWYCYTLAATPAFWLGLLLLMVFSVWLGWFPLALSVPAGVPADQVTLADRMSHMLLPAIVLSISGIASVALHTRSKLSDVLDSPYVLYARARGERGLQLFWRHGLRHAALPAVTLQFAAFGELFGGAVLVEQVFSYPGLGQATVQAGVRGDVPLLLGMVLCSACFVFAGNLLADLIAQLLDPRLGQGGEGHEASMAKDE
ncbi:ABC transporter permease [Paenibacillus sp. SYP-B4298]|uniref:ABC transporter permease n=1 Tax=Paenibacillus sp. SYP-B4298 TaxID=2996034 RepID=UPI0022DD0B3F|nr:ABC transporter permease [Paenibacillus sp. SYP-B4298]